MTQDTALVSAEIFTPSHRYIGKVATRGSRLADFLNNTTTEVIEMRDVTVLQPTNPLAQPLTCAHLHLKKDVILVAVPTGHYEAPSRRLYSYIEKNQHSAHVSLRGCCLLGTLHLPDGANQWYLLGESTTVPSFIPITDVAVQFAAPGTETLRMRVAIFRRQHIESLFIAPVTAASETVGQLSAQLRSLDISDIAKQLALATAVVPAAEPLSAPLQS